MNAFCHAMLMMMLGGSMTAVPMPMNPQPSAEISEQSAYVKYENLKWDKLFPNINTGEDSAKITFLHINPQSSATQLLIRCPKNFHVPKHWHTANETIFVVSGNFVMRDEDGGEANLGPGSFCYMPKKMVHEGWSSQGNLLFVTTDGAWDIHFVDGPPTAQQLQDLSKKPALP